MTAEGPVAAPPPKGGRSLTGFYIAMGVVAALVGLGAWLWTPLRIRYYEWKIVRCCPPYRRATLISRRPDAVRAAESLVGTGSRAYAACERLLQDPNALVHWTVLQAIEKHRASWALPLVVKNAQMAGPHEALRPIRTIEGFVEDEDPAVRAAAAEALRRIWSQEPKK